MRDQTADLLTASQLLFRYKCVHTPQNTLLRGRFLLHGMSSILKDPSEIMELEEIREDQWSVNCRQKVVSPKL